MMTLLKRAAMTLSLGAFATATLAQADVKLQGAGATFPNPLYQRWIAEYTKAHPSVKIDYQSIGSGGGIKGITEKTVDFAGSDAPLNKKERAELEKSSKVVQIPTCAGSVVPAYNIPGVTGEIKFSGDVLADIYLGTITKWNDARLTALNPDAKLPDLAITPAWRTDGSGTTFVWTNYLCTQSDKFKETIGPGKQVSFKAGQGGKGNEGVAAVVQQTKGAIGYVELNYADANKIPFGSVKNKDGKFVKATPATVSAAGKAAKFEGTVLQADIWNQPGAEAYPVSSFTYIIVYKELKTRSGTTHEQAEALVDFLTWAVTDGQKVAGSMSYAPLADSVQKSVKEAIDQITFDGKPVLKK